MATKGSKKSSGSKGSAKKSSKAAASKRGGSKKAAASAKKGAGKKSGGKGKSLISPKVKKIAGSILGAAAAGAFKGVVEEVVPKVEKAAGVPDNQGKGK